MLIFLLFFIIAIFIKATIDIAICIYYWIRKYRLKKKLEQLKRRYPYI